MLPGPLIVYHSSSGRETAKTLQNTKKWCNRDQSKVRCQRLLIKYTAIVMSLWLIQQYRSNTVICSNINQVTVTVCVLSITYEILLTRLNVTGLKYMYNNMDRSIYSLLGMLNVCFMRVSL